MRLEARDRAEIEALLAERARLVLPISTAFVGFNALDWVVYPQHASRWLLYRVAIFALTTFVWWSHAPSRSGRGYPLAAVYAFAFSLSIAVMTYESGGFASWYYAGILAVAAGTFVLFPVELRRGLVLVALLLAPYFALALWHGVDDPARAVSSTVFMLTVAAFLLLGGHLSTALFVEQRRGDRRLRELVHALEESSRRDPLTKLFNRGHLQEEVARALARHARGEAPFGFVLADLDRFKTLNDRHGHPAGDLALREVARTLDAATRSEDVVCRYGGEEFAVLLPGAGPEAARAAAERLRSEVERLRVEWRGTPLALGLSVGVATARPGDDAESLIRRADAALYRAKSAGRNRVESAEAPSAPEARPDARAGRLG